MPLIPLILAFSLAQPAPVEPLSIDAARKAFQLPPGFKIELAASDPQIQSPVAMAFAADGRMWVVEMPDYPNGPAPGKPPEGRIRVLEDKDGDGVFETAHTFADSLLFANGLLPWKDGVIVTAAPHIVLLRDTDGDGKADKKEILFEGFATQNPQLRVSHPVLGLDGWVYVANGLRGGSIIAANNKDAKPIALGGMDFRFNPITLEGEAISGMGQFGNTFDEWGNRFVCDNRNHLRHVVLENRYLRRNPALAVPSLLEDVWGGEPGALNSGAPLYPLSKNWTTSNLHAGRFTAACGVLIDRGSALPFRGDAFTCDPTGNLVHREILTPHGATFRGKPAYDKKEFLASPDDWFRPVFLAHGPDGGLYVVDMHRAVIEHPEFMPPELKNRPDLMLGKHTGRIWRVVPEKGRDVWGWPWMPNEMKSKDLVTFLGQSNGWIRATAHRLLLERGDETVVPILRESAVKSIEAQARIQSAWVLEAMGKLDDETLLHLLKNDKTTHPRVLEQAVILAEKRIKEAKFYDGVADAASFPDARVRFQAALSIGESKFADVYVALARIVRESEVDRWTRLAIASSVASARHNRAGDLLATVPEADPTLLFELAKLGGGDPEQTKLVLETLGRKLVGPRARVVVLGLAEGIAGRGAKLDLADDRISRVMQQAVRDAVNRDVPHADRLEAIRLIACDPANTETLLRLIDDPEPAIRIRAVQGISTLSPANASQALLAVWPQSGSTVRQEIANALLIQPDRTKVLLDAVEKGAISPRDLDATTIRRLIQNRQFGNRAAELLKAAQPGDRKKAIERYRAALDLKGDPVRGREVFTKSCAACHKIAGIGQTTGPDISDTRTKTLEQLLTDILDPNLAIDGGAIAYIATTKSGKTYSGLIAAETASSITLRRAEAQLDVILRTDLDELRSTGKSLMPEGLEADIPVERMADLLAFLKNWRYIEPK